MYTLLLFGPPSIEQSGQPVKGLRSRKALALLAYVATGNRPQPRSHLAELFWPGETEERCLANLRWVLNHLTSLLPGCLNTSRHAVDVGKGITSDLQSFSQYIQRNTNATLAAAADLYRGEFMAGFALDGCPEFELWLAAERERRLQQAIQTISTLAHHAAAQGNAQWAIRYFRRWLDLAPWHEEAHQRLIYWLAATGQPSAALQQYNFCRDALANELGVTPSPETVALSEEIKAHGRAANGTLLSLPSRHSMLPFPAHNLPRQLAPVVGRERELAYIAARLADPACAWLTLLGPGGIGKSVLAVEAAYAQLLHFADGVWFVPLASIPSPDLLPTTIAQTLALPLQPGSDLPTQLLNYLAGKQMLLILDNFEQLLDGVSLLDAIIMAAPRVKLLVTSRQRLRHQAEWVLELRGLAVPPQDAVEGIESYSAVQLFVQSAQRAEAGFALSAAEAPHITEICRILAGMPLGIKLAAAWVCSLSCAAIATEIKQNLDLGSLAPYGLPDRHQSLRAVINSSWHALSQQEQEVLAKLAIFQGEFGLDAAQQVAGATTELLAGLIDKSLLHFDGNERYALHALLCHFGLEQLQANGYLKATGDAHARYYSNWLAQYAGALKGPRPQSVLRLIDRELDNIRAAWRWAIENILTGVIVMATPGISLYHDYRTLLQEGLQLFAAAATWLKDAPPSAENEIARSKVLGYYGLYLFRFAQPVQAEAALRESLALATKHQAKAEMAYAFYVLGYNAIAAQDPQGENYLLSGLRLAEQLQDPFLVVKILYAFGWYYSYLNREQESLAALERALNLARELGDLRSEAHILYYMGRVRSELGLYPQARKDLEQSLHLFQELEVFWGIAQAENGLVTVAYALKDYAEVKRLCEIAIPLYEKIKAHSNNLASLKELYALVSVED